MESAFSPNTSAFLNYLNTLPQDFDTSNNDISLTDNDISLTNDKTQTSFPPSAFFNSMPVPGRDTPEDTPPSGPDSVSPETNEKQDTSRAEIALSDESDDTSPGAHPTKIKPKRKNIGAGTHKRKAGQTNAKAAHTEDDEDDDSDSDAPSGHEDKKAHPNDKAPGRKGRKSAGGEGKEPNKAARRKEQNRAAQKAFRERREAKVKDLEEKVAELEAKSYGANIENENLRGILKRLQEENIALKQSAFTFSMPVNGNEPNKSPNTSANNSLPKPQRQVSKPPSPPQTNTDDSLKSIHDLPSASHRASLGGMGDSPESLVSVGSASSSSSGQKQQSASLPDEAFNAFLFGSGNRPDPYPVQQQDKQPTSNTSQSFSTMSTSSSSVTPPSTSQSDINALWASLYPNGLNNSLANQPLFNHSTGPYTLLNSQPDFMSFANAGENMFAPPPPPPQPIFSQQQQTQTQPDFNRFAFRDPSAAVETTSAVADRSNSWNDVNDNGMSEFLASLAGSTTNNEVDNTGGADDDAFNAQLQQIFGGSSPSNLFNIGTDGKGFSPNNYLNMSPSPLQSVSNGQSPQSQTSTSRSGSNDKSNSASPDSSTSVSSSSHAIASQCLLGQQASMAPGLSTFGPPKSASEMVHVVDENGNIVKPSDMWIRFGMTTKSAVDHLVIDDLCDQMRAKATCKDGKLQLSVKDAEKMFSQEGTRSHQEWLDRFKGRLSGP
ncbi:hypothetical protein I316_01264 [Kwoniella heveanensis BCC8398]|uniref:BZIP domain-containing protein n=1 Tax=Kwoniella heveanensis BCC8398 TaxID=1296120 RepID=A0A1B9H078_9TREE|nr:hypothetical protein I316_01264 [Kwoniella heveanensis BCC8398]